MSCSVPAIRMLLTAVLIAGGGASSAAAPCRPAPQTFDYAAYAPEIVLHLDEMVSLPPATVVLAGTFRDAANAVHPALLTSQDRGETWSTTPLGIHGAGLGPLQSDGVASIWGIVAGVQEGTDEPLYLLRSRDAGRTWCAIPLDGLDTLNGVAFFRLFDDRHGLIVFSEAPFGGVFHGYQTLDGGDSWQSLWRADGTPPEAVEPAADYPDRGHRHRRTRRYGGASRTCSPWMPSSVCGMTTGTMRSNAWTSRARDPGGRCPMSPGRTVSSAVN